jgi:hypothetical protein
MYLISPLFGGIQARRSIISTPRPKMAGRGRDSNCANYLSELIDRVKELLKEI